MIPFKPASVLCLFAGLMACTGPADTHSGTDPQVGCDVEFIILGTGQDAGAPQIGNPKDPAWKDPNKILLAASAALVDHRSGQRFLFEATPDIRAQLQHLDELAPSLTPGLGVSGVFITHAHIGHYAGLMFFGRESAGTTGIPVHVMPRMAGFLAANGPWSQLVDLGNIKLEPLPALQDIQILGDGVSVSPFKVPHRDEYSETVGYVIKGPTKSALFLPDIDSWEAWDVQAQQPFFSEPDQTTIQAFVQYVDYAYLDATFYDDNELPGRDMSKIPHPRVTETMDLFQDRAASERAKIRFFHINHTNPIRFESSPQYKAVIERGYGVAKKGDRVCLSD
jgi:pyrroloquinoline quinone biosynthesis protein B